MTAGASSGPRPSVRRPLRVAVGATAVGLFTTPLWAQPAMGEVPEGWETPPEVNTLDALLLLVGAPLGLFVLITLAVLVPSLARGEPLGRPEESQWLGGPSKDPKELTAPSAGADTGGASGRW